VVSSGVKDSEGHPLAFNDIATIEATAIALGILSVSSPGSAGSTQPAGSVSKDEWIAFEQAYYRLAMETSPVTAETLRNTRFAAGAGGAQAPACRLSFDGIVAGLCGRSPAQRFTRLLWALTIFFALFVVVSQGFIDYYGMKTHLDTWNRIRKDTWEVLQPWAYGGLGACAYLLHRLIYQRSFDLRRKPEYFNRILLGAVSGGAIILFSDYLLAQSDSVTKIGTTALGFIAGYSSDFLFTTVERIITAIFPRVAVETVPKEKQQKKPAKPPGAGGGQGGAAGGGGGAGGGGDGAAGQGGQGPQGGGGGTAH
jgi:uncharacterized membrane protein YgcG